MTSLDVAPEQGELVRVRGEHWVVVDVKRSRQPIDELASVRLPGRTLVSLMNVSGDDVGEELRLIWEIEPGHRVVASDQLPEVTEQGWDDPQRLGAFLDAVRWGTVASADTTTLQAPFRAGISLHTHQLAPVAKALSMPRVNLLIADDVGLGKTIEAGLVIQEMLLRHRARRILVVCPAPLTGKWREEMGSKFGLDFTVLDAEALRDLRRTHGPEANPFTVFPRTIISLQWLRTPRVNRLLEAVLKPKDRHTGFFDLLVVDEVHHCTPAVPRGGARLAVDSKQTQAVRKVAEYSQHRLFLSATPHNGYEDAWRALLAMLEPQRFMPGVAPERSVLEEVMVRRLKTEIMDEGNKPVFQPRVPRAIDVHYSQDEEQIHNLLERYRHARISHSGRSIQTNDLLTLLLKKRLFSSPAAFHRTLTAHTATVLGSGRQAVTDDGALDWLEEAAEWDAETPDDEPGSVVEQELLLRLVHTANPVGEDGHLLLEEMRVWCERFADRSDSKAQALVAEIERILSTDPADRVIIFTEYTATQTWLAEILTSRGLGGERLGLLHGGMDPKRREHLKAAFQAAPHRDPLRILLATDMASEGIDLQNHCHRIIHYDIPFNPNRLEQRIGRVDRLGQRHPVDVVHFVGAGWETAEPESYKNDLEYLSRVAKKIAIERRDLGSVNPVLAAGVEARMLGRKVYDDPLVLEPMPGVETGLMAAEQDMRAHAQRLREQLNRSERKLHVAPDNIRRVVDTALTLADQPALVDVGPDLVEVPELRHGWERTLIGLTDPLSGETLPLTFNGSVAESRDDVVQAHLEYPLVSHSSSLLRSAIWGSPTRLHRVAAVRVTLPDDSGITDLLAVAFARLVVVGADGHRLHEEVLPVARAIPATGRSRRIDLGQLRKQDPKEDDSKERLRRAIEDGFGPKACFPAPEAAKEQFLRAWGNVERLLARDVQDAGQERLTDLDKELGRRKTEEQARVRDTFSQLEATLRSALASPTYAQLSIEDLLTEERTRVERDRAAWQARIDGLGTETERELQAVERRYQGVKDLVFPFAVALCVPQGWTGQ
ncbi:DEAD/DEAH box helicase [Actinomadura sp. NAK00032]|uniref:DISARM system SNF2-like helicase DrmD n=1 Tax=Actinomadura sp. NAK00032 TaxID=2742128 RepID=UPI00158FADBB|nr:DISARM system SNF2-like helicase DrmD [Actinomadura sp. NAK00032]QKW39927.1 DEAD/DEAH box helicase [Actinomadura sp. NAK00032]